MKIKIKTKEGLSKDVSAKNITINGVKLVDFHNEFLSLKRDFKVFKDKYDEDIKEVHKLWKEVKLR